MPPRARVLPPREWAAQSLAHLNPEWAEQLYNLWLARARPRPLARPDWPSIPPAANRWLVQMLEKINGASPYLLGASDDDICEAAQRKADTCNDLWASLCNEWSRFKLLQDIVLTAGITPDWGKKTAHQAVLRMLCPIWWRRQLRKVSARATEQAAHVIHRVHRAAGCYASDVAVARRAQQNTRNARALAATTIHSDDGQSLTLEQIALHSIANKTIRAGELMLRARGFEEIARDRADVCMFVTITCPSRMHSMRIGTDGKPEVNPSYDGTTPRQAQQYLSHNWALTRAALARHKTKLYGIRVAEPHHDGTPHWHMLLFMPEAPDTPDGLSAHAVLDCIKAYALRDSPDEPGADRRRVDFVRIQPDEGSAAGYIAKYLSKNLDGIAIEEDLFGNKGITAAKRVDAWASTWGIRQFQQVGGPPVGVWRELRRCNPQETPEDAPEHLRAAITAVNRIETIDRDGASTIQQRASWAAYVRAQGGPHVGRSCNIVIRYVQDRSLGRYEDEKPDRPEGVTTTGTVFERFGIIPSWPRLKDFFMSSHRKRWFRRFNPATVSTADLAREFFEELEKEGPHGFP
jgi:Bacteriophage replication gene A protein (GPA)